MTDVEVITKYVRLELVFAPHLQDLKQNSTNNEQKVCKKQSVNIKDEFYFSAVHGSMTATGHMQSK